MWGILVRREIRLRMRKPMDILYAVVFFALILMLHALVWEERATRAQMEAMAAPVIWIGLILATASALGSMWKEHHKGGTLEQYMAAGQWGWAAIWAYAIAEMVMTGIPLGITALGLTGLWFPVSGAWWWHNMAAWGLALPAMWWLGLLAAALVVALPHAGMLVAVLVLPLYIPIVVWGCGINRMADFGLPVTGPLALLAAFSMGCAALCPWGIRAALKWGTA